MMLRSLSAGSSLLVLVLLLFPGPAGAQADAAEEEKMMNQAFELAKDGKIEESASVLEDLVAKGSKNALYNLGLLWENAREYEKAVKYYEEYLKDPLSTDTIGEIEKLEEHVIALEDEPSKIMIDTEPTGALVRKGEDGQTLGTTPLTVQLGPGEHELLFVLDGYEKASTVVKGGFGKSLAFKEKLVPLMTETEKMGTLVVEADVEGAVVLINGAEECETPCKLDVPAGEYEVLVRMEGCEDYVTTVLVDSGDRTTVTATPSGKGEVPAEKLPEKTREDGWGHRKHVYLLAGAGPSLAWLGKDAEEIPVSGAYGLRIGYTLFAGDRAAIDLGVAFGLNPLDLYPDEKKLGFFLDIYAEVGARIRLVRGLSIGLHVGVGALVMFGADDRSVMFPEGNISGDGFGGFLLRGSLRVGYDFPCGFFLFLEPGSFSYSPRFDKHLVEEIDYLLRYQTYAGLGIRF